MNLRRLYLQNYKQYRRPLELYPPEGAIGVIGTNGAGKSSLFESILWAFFGSQRGDYRFANDSIPWEGGSRKDDTVVEVTLESGGQDYTVRRRLRNGQTTAEVASGESTLVTGSKEVGQWVEEHLLGMDRTAFEATFFARQKELEFFAHDSGIERMRKISRMLGIDRVEAAQKLLREDRRELAADARVAAGKLAGIDPEEIKGRLQEARTVHHRLEAELHRARERQRSAEEALEGHRSRRRELEKLYNRHHELEGELQKARSEERLAADRVRSAREGLEEVSRAEAELASIEPHLEGMAALERELEELEKRRQESQRREDLREERLECHRRLAEIERELLQTLEKIQSGGGVPLEGWDSLFELEGHELIASAIPVLERAPQRLEEAQSRVEDLEEAVRLQRSLAETRERHVEAKKEVERLEADSRGITGGEDLESREQQLREEKERLDARAAKLAATADYTEREAENLQEAAGAISGEDGECPTCHRPFEEGEHGEVLATLERQSEELRRRAHGYRRESGECSASARRTQKSLREVLQRLRRLRSVEGELSGARERERERREALEREREELDALVRRTGSCDPSAELKRATGSRDALQALRDALPTVRGFSREHHERREKLSGISASLEQLATLEYDPQEHAEKKRQRDALAELRGRAGELRRSAEHRAGLEKELRKAEADQRAAAEEAQELEKKLETLGFDHSEYGRSAELVEAAEKDVAEAGRERERLSGERRDADHRLKSAEKELQDYEQERAAADEKEAAVARMKDMDELFTEFFTSLTSRVRPLLENEASGLVAELTEGRYQRLEFDENYGVRLVDRFEDAHPLARFSGGEADVASLCARVALSKIVAQKSDETLGFLILDEVFGSLDAGRRTNVMQALEQFKRYFAQIFIISHVGEVQESALVDEIWSVEEDEEGQSAVNCIRPGEPVV